MNKVYLRLHGAASKKARKLIFSSHKNIEIGLIDNVVFCDYSDFTIPLGQVFNFLIIEETPKIIIPANIKLIWITQQFFKEWEEIPMGWKTICGFEYEKKDLFERLPVIDAWDTNSKFIISTREADYNYSEFIEQNYVG